MKRLTGRLCVTDSSRICHAEFTLRYSANGSLESKLFEHVPTPPVGTTAGALGKSPAFQGSWHSDNECKNWVRPEAVYKKQGSTVLRGEREPEPSTNLFW
jgi:hypothetical protein